MSSIYNYLFSENINKVTFFLFSASVFIITFTINKTSTISFTLFLFILILFCYFLLKEKVFFIGTVFSFYSLVMLILFLAQKYFFPNFQGFSGPGNASIDDMIYFFQANPLRELPNFINPDLVQRIKSSPLPFSKVLKGVIFFLPFKNIHLLDLLFFNTIAITFIPVFVFELSFSFFKEKKIAIIAFIFALICPLLIQNSLFLIRDGWTAMLYIGALLFVAKNQYLLTLIFSAILWYLRPASGIQLFFSLIPLFIYFNFNKLKSNKKRGYIIIMISISIFIALLPFGQNFMKSHSLSLTNFFRMDFMENLRSFDQM